MSYDYEKYLHGLSDKELEQKINNCQCWDMDLLSELCRRAGLSKAWEESTDLTFEKIAYRAAEMLGLNI